MTKVYDNATDLITFARLQAQNTTSGSSYLGSDGLLKFAAEDEPRIEYAADGSLKGLLIEEQRTNIITYSEDFSQDGGFGGAGGTITSTNNPAPSGSNVATLLTTASGIVYYYKLVALSGATNKSYSVSCWVKGVTAGTKAKLRIGFFGGTTTSVFYEDVYHDLSTTEWTRLTFSAVSSVSDRTSAQAVVRTETNGELLVWGLQLEEGSFATSYIPTSGSQSTRSPDIASIPVSAFGYNQEAGTVVVDVDSMKDGETQRVLSINNSASSWTIRTDLLKTGSNNISNYTVDGGSVQTDHVVSVTGLTSFTVAATFAPDDYSMCVNGGTVVAETDGTPTVPTVDTFRLGGGISSPLNGHIKSIQYFPRRLTDAQLQELTA